MYFRMGRDYLVNNPCKNGEKIMHYFTRIVHTYIPILFFAQSSFNTYMNIYKNIRTNIHV